MISHGDAARTAKDIYHPPYHPTHADTCNGSVCLCQLSIKCVDRAGRTSTGRIANPSCVSSNLTGASSKVVSL